MAFDEEIRGPGLGRKWRETQVLTTGEVVRPTYRVVLEDGSEVIASAEHKWLVRTPKGNRLEWIETQNLKLGKHRLMKLADVWPVDTSYEAGYLAATLDGEGCLSFIEKDNGGHCARLSFAQKDNPMAATACEYLDLLGFEWHQTRRDGASGFEINGRRAEVLRFLGQVRPKRLLEKFQPEKLGELYGKSYLLVEGLEFLGDQKLIALGTGTKTLIIEGFASHNSAPPTAPSIVNDAADHLAGNWPQFIVKPTGESQNKIREQERVQMALGAMYDLLAREYDKALHRTLAINGGWSGLMAARVLLHDDWDYEHPTAADFTWQPLDPRFVFPDPGSLGREFVILRQRRTVGSVRQMWPDWEGQWYEPQGWGQWNTSPDDNNNERLRERLADTSVVDWIEYWDDEVKCFICNGFPVFRSRYGRDILPHALGCNPIVIKAAGYGNATGEIHERFRSMLFYAFHLLTLESNLLTQYKWIIEDTAWPVWLAPESMRGIDVTPGTVNYVPDRDDIKVFRSMREDAVEPKAIIDMLAWVQNAIERATYPVILKGQAPRGMSAGYPIAILSSQAKLKFAAATDALEGMLKDLAERTLLIIADRVEVPITVIDGLKLEPGDFDKYFGRIKVKLAPNLPTDRAASIPLLEFAVGTLGLPKEIALRELGYEDPIELRALRVAEDLEDDPRVRQEMAHEFLKDAIPAYADAVEKATQDQGELQQLQVQQQKLQIQLQIMQLKQQEQQMQMQAAQAQQAAQGPMNPITGQRPAPMMAGPALPPGPEPAPNTTPGIAVPGQAGGSSAMGQNPGAPGEGNASPRLDPNTAIRGMASQARAFRTISDLASQADAYGTPQGGGI